MCFGDDAIAVASEGDGYHVAVEYGDSFVANSSDLETVV